MIKHNQDGAVSGVAISLIFTVILLVAAIGFGAWSYASRQDYKENSDTKVNLAVQKAVAAESAKKDKQFKEDEKKPLRTYNGPETLGSMVIQYPKTWSGYVDTSGSSFNVYFSPGLVPTVNDQNSIYALRIQVVNQGYAQIVQTYSTRQHSSSSNYTISAYTLPKLPKVVGVEISGTFSDKKSGTIVILPLRSQTIEISTDGNQFLSDFNNYILPNLSFSP